MRFRGHEQAAVMTEPRPLGVEVDPASAALYDEFAAGRTYDEIYQLWKDPAVTNPTIRQRAVTVLTAPHGYSVPFPHNEQSLGRLLHINEEVNGAKTSSLRDRLADRPELVAELSQGVLYWLDTTGGRINGDSLDSRHSYLAVIRELLPLADDQTADKLFGHYPINDFESDFGPDDSSGYRPLTSLLYDQAVPRRFKDAGLEAWFTVAKQEELGGARPRAEHERATSKMAEFALTWTYGEVDDVTHTAVIGFLEQHHPAQTYIKGYAAAQVAEHIIDEDLRFNFGWRHVVVGSDESWGHFTVDDDKDLAFVDWLLDRCHERQSTYFDAKAEALIHAYETAQRDKLVKQASEVALQARLRS